MIAAQQALTTAVEACEHTVPFTLQYVAGGDNIKMSMRYVDPREDAVEKLFARLGKSAALGDSCRMQKVGAIR